MREGGSCATRGGGRRLQSNNWRPRCKIFWQQRGRSGDGDVTGVAGARGERRSRPQSEMGG